jgi:hypothetical protein
VVLTDLRGYGDSGKPEGGGRDENYSFRAMAQDLSLPKIPSGARFEQARVSLANWRREETGCDMNLKWSALIEIEEPTDTQITKTTRAGRRATSNSLKFEICETQHARRQLHRLHGATQA